MTKKTLCLSVFACATILGFQLARGQQPPNMPSQPSAFPTPAMLGSTPPPLAQPAPQPEAPPLPPPPPSIPPGAVYTPPQPPQQPPMNSYQPPMPSQQMAPPPVAPPPGLPQATSPQVANSGQANQKFEPSVIETILPAVERLVLPRVILRTTMGDITLTLNSTEAPKMVQNFIDLVRGEKEFVDVNTSKKTKRPFYNGLFFHRVVSGYLIQAGCPFGTGRGGPGYVLPDEVTPNMKFNRPGLVAMAPEREGSNLKKDANGSQFFITLREMPEWDGKLTIIGEVTRGMSIVQKISKVKVGPTERPIRRVYINTAEVIDEKPVNASDFIVPAPENP